MKKKSSILIKKKFLQAKILKKSLFETYITVFSLVYLELIYELN